MTALRSDDSERRYEALFTHDETIHVRTVEAELRRRGEMVRAERERATPAR